MTASNSLERILWSQRKTTFGATSTIRSRTLCVNGTYVSPTWRELLTTLRRVPESESWSLDRMQPVGASRLTRRGPCAKRAKGPGNDA